MNAEPVSLRQLHEAMEALARYTARRDRIDAAAAADMERAAARINAWRDRQLGETPERIRLVSEAIGQMAAEYVRVRPTKSIDTPYGVITTRTGDHWEWDDAAALAWAAEHPAFVAYSTPKPPVARIDKEAVKAAAIVNTDGTVGVVTADGEIVTVAGAHVEIARTVVGIKPADMSDDTGIYDETDAA